MPWFYVDDGFSDSKPVLNMPDRYRLAACGLWVLAGSWSAKEELDGFVPKSKLRQLGARAPIIAALTDSGPLSAPLCTEVSGGIQFNSWDKWQPTKAELVAERLENERKREAEAERKRRERAEKNGTNEAGGATRSRRRRKGRNAVTSVDARLSTEETVSVSEICPDGHVAEIQPDSRTRADARLDPTRPDPTRPEVDNSPTEESSPDVGVERGLSDAISPTASRLVATVIPDSIPAAVRTMLRIRASELISGDGIDPDIVADALRRWLTKPDAGPGLLPALAADVIRARAAPMGGKPHKLRSIAQLAAAERAREQAQLANLPRQELE